MSCNIDDMTPEELAYATGILMKNALDVDVESILMKKGRMAFKLTVLCKVEDKKKLLNMMFKETSTIGIKEESILRHSLKREFDYIELFGEKFKLKRTFLNGEVLREKLEYDFRRGWASNNNLSILGVKM